MSKHLFPGIIKRPVIQTVLILMLLPAIAWSNCKPLHLENVVGDTVIPKQSIGPSQRLTLCVNKIPLVNDAGFYFSFDTADRHQWRIPLQSPPAFPTDAFFDFFQPELPGYWLKQQATVPAKFRSANPLLVYGAGINEHGDRKLLFTSLLQQVHQGVMMTLRDSIKINQRWWKVNQFNRLYFFDGGFRADSVRISNDSTTVLIKSRLPMLNSALDIDFRQFSLNNLMKEKGSTTELFTGSLNAQFSIDELYRLNPAINGKMVLNNMQVYRQPIGSLAVDLMSEPGGGLAFDGELNERGNNVSVKGNFKPNAAGPGFNARFAIDQLQLQVIQALARGKITGSTGKLTGLVDISRQKNRTHWSGYLQFDSTAFSVASTGTSCHLHQQRITLQYPLLNFENFTIKDSAGNQLTANGTITHVQGYDDKLDLDIRSDGFKLLNTSRSISNQLYGHAYADCRLKLSGSIQQPGLAGSITLTDKSTITLVLPQSNVNRDAASAIVKFIKTESPKFQRQELLTPVVESRRNNTYTYNDALKINLLNNTLVNLVIDPATGDALQVQGTAVLKAGVDTAGQLLLSGRYQLDSGWYMLNYDFLRRRFRLSPGSNIDFNGPVAVAGLNITAAYTAITSARDLLENEIPGLTPELETALDQELPFNVVLHMKGALGKPAIQFDIQLADSAAGLNNLLRIPILRKLAQLQQDASGVNRQVFSLLLLNRFVGEQSTDFFKGSGEGFSDISSESVSKFLLSELDKIAADLFKGLDMEMNLNTFKDYTAGDAQQKAVPGIGVTKSFINNRLFITVGRNFGIEGQDANAKAARQKGVAFLPDVTSSLQLTADGKYLLRSYRKSQQEVVVDGYVTESGLGFILRLDYDSFQQLTRRRLVNRIEQ